MQSLSTWAREENSLLLITFPESRLALLAGTLCVSVTFRSGYQDFRTRDFQSKSRNFLEQWGSTNSPIDPLPMVVRFKDINDPDSLEEVDPRDFGPGGRIVRATIQVTESPVTPLTDVWPAWLLAEAEAAHPADKSCRHLLLGRSHLHRCIHRWRDVAESQMQTIRLHCNFRSIVVAERIETPPRSVPLNADPRRVSVG